jgi:hypothetical protein
MKKAVLSLLIAFAGTPFLQAKSIETLHAPQNREVIIYPNIKGLQISSAKELQLKSLNTAIQQDAEMTGGKLFHTNQSLQSFFSQSEVQNQWVGDHLLTGKRIL